MSDALIFLVAYFIGSIPTGLLVGFIRGIDVRKYGSGNIGATNVARMLGLKYFFIVFFLDSFKAFAYLMTLNYLEFSQYVLIGAAIALLFGNGCSIFLQLRGGKGISTTFGILLALHPQLLLAMFTVWLLAFALTRVVGMASVMAMLSLPIFSHFWFHDQPVMVQLAVVIATWCLFLHWSNIKNYMGKGS